MPRAPGKIQTGILKASHRLWRLAARHDLLTQAAKAYAFLQGRGYVTPEDVKSIGPDVLRHRILLTYEAEAENTTSEDIITKLFAAVEVP